MQKLYAVLLIVALALMDQVSKWWIIEVFFRPRVFEADGASQRFMDWFTTVPQDKFPPARYEWAENLNIVMVWNEGISFGMLSSDHAFMPMVLSVSAFLLAAGLFVWLWRTPHITTSLPLAMVIAGALANIWDRIRFGAVADFIDFHVKDWHYPAFNLADSCIVVGVLWLAFDGIVLEARRMAKKEEELAKEAAPDHIDGNKEGSN
ncbi:MAG: signal peptidase II [Pseudobdellovibrionaceae bacterium]|nr:signal peptidase II [Pseudobdellovibrionaceae bacterium]